MASYHVHNPNYSTNTPSGSFSSSSSSTASTSLKDKNKKSSAKAVKLSTDPQSIAARQRRHRISDRFKTLQSLVPGGSKLDTVSMLEEAIQYVKFLKNQIWIHQSMNMMISSSDYHVEDRKCTDVNVVSDQHALVQSGNYCGESDVYLGSNDDIFGQMQLSELPCPLPEGLHFQGQNCNFVCDSQCLEWSFGN